MLKSFKVSWYHVRHVVLAALLLIATLLLLPKNEPRAPKVASLQLPLTSKAQKVVEKEARYSVAFVGDSMFARSIGTQVIAGSDPFQYVSSYLKTFDAVVANVETTIAPEETAKQQSKLYTFNSPKQSLDSIANHVSLAVLANNHTRDYGATATAAMLDWFEEKQIAYVGAGNDLEEAYRPYTLVLKKIDQPPIKIGVIAFNDIENVYTNVKTGQPGSAYYDFDLLKQSIDASRENGADAIVVIPHWGVEYAKQPNDRQRQIAHALLDAGADAVIGNHPHVIQPTEIYNGKLIIYSLGNFIFDGMSGDALEGQIIDLSFTLKVKSQIVGKKEKVLERTTVISAPNSRLYHIGSNGFPRLVE